jgi:tetraacyldisaccharide 4'-kinase
MNNMIIIRILLIPFSILYSFIILLRNFFYSRNIFKIHTVSIPVISVGNISTGGTGKSPFVIFLSEYFMGLGKKPAIISRGYKGKSDKEEIVFDGKNIVCTSDKCGDEPMMIAESLSHLKKEFYLSTGSNRAETAKNIINKFNTDVFILDDAFQHRRIHRNVDVVLVDAEEMGKNKFANTFPLPAGNLRECFYNLKRADIIIQNNKFSDFEILKKLNKFNKDIFILKYSVKGFYNINSEEFSIKGKDVCAFAGIAKRFSFFNNLKDKCNLTNKISFGDHHSYTSKDIELITKNASKDTIFITTEKDFVKIKEFKDFIKDFNVLFMKIELNLSESEKFFTLIQNKSGMVK